MVAACFYFGFNRKKKDSRSGIKLTKTREFDDTIRGTKTASTYRYLCGRRRVIPLRKRNLGPLSDIFFELARRPVGRLPFYFSKILEINNLALPTHQNQLTTPYCEKFYIQLLGKTFFYLWEKDYELRLKR